MVAKTTKRIAINKIIIDVEISLCLMARIFDEKFILSDFVE